MGAAFFLKIYGVHSFYTVLQDKKNLNLQFIKFREFLHPLFKIAVQLKVLPVADRKTHIFVLHSALLSEKQLHRAAKQQEEA